MARERKQKLNIFERGFQLASLLLSRHFWMPLVKSLGPAISLIRGWKVEGTICPACGLAKMIREDGTFFRCNYCRIRKRIAPMLPEYDFEYWTMDKGEQGLGPELVGAEWAAWGSGRLYHMKMLGVMQAGLRSIELGCAEGALVRALAKLGQDAWGERQ